MRRDEQRDATRASLVRAATVRFARDGYAAASLPGIVAEAGVTKGALYHHFGSKAALFRAVLTEVQTSVAAQVAKAADAERDPWQQLQTGCRAFLAASTAPAVRQIMLIDGPAVIGWAAWRALDESTSAQHLLAAIASLTKASGLEGSPTVITRLLSGAMNEAALWLAESKDLPRDLDAAMTTLERMLAGLQPSPPLVSDVAGERRFVDAPRVKQRD